MRNLGPSADDGILRFDERAQLCFVTESGAGAKVGVRPDRGVVSNLRLAAVRPHHRRAVTDCHIGQCGVWSDFAVVADSCGAEQLAAGTDDGVPADGDVDVSSTCCRDR